VHLQYLASSSLRLSVFLQWVWTMLTSQRGSRLIVNRHGSELEETVPVPSEFLHNRSALERQGALVFQLKQCHNCHSLDDQGGKPGPALDAVAVRLTQDQLIRQVIQGGGNMPAYGKNLNPAETTALVAFLETLHPAGQSPARDASRAIALGTEAGEPPSTDP
jgi:cytochrome c5